jgi:hypothetical protein
MSLFTGFTTTKKTPSPINRNAMTSLMKVPYRNSLLRIANLRSLKSVFPRDRYERGEDVRNE